MSYASDKPPNPSPDPNRRRCRQCQTVSTGLVAVGRRKFKTVLWSWYHPDCVPGLSSGEFVHITADEETTQ